MTRMMNKTMKKLQYLMVVLGSMLLGGCSDYFDVRPKSQVLAAELFSTEQGFDDQLVGVYKRLASTTLYGQEMTFGLMEALTQNYSLAAGNPYEEAAAYNYENMGIESKIGGIWKEMYAAVANLNILLDYADRDLSIFSGTNYERYKGEALALRGFIHLELLRIFAPAYTALPDAPGIPYVTRYTTTVTPQSTVREALGLAIGDLEEGLRLLETVEAAETETGISGISADSYRFNAYTARAVLARAYQWQGAEGNANALRYAEAIIDSEHYDWVWYQSISDGDQSTWDRMFSEELIFRLNVTDLIDITDPYFKNTGDGTQTLSPSAVQWEDIYELDRGYGTDYRYTKWWAYDGGTPYFAKYWQSENGMYADFVPVIRKAEMYYIAAEALLDTDPAQAVRYLNEVRTARSISDPLPEDLEAGVIREEIYKEYRKETMGEGQLFYYYKRMGYENIPGLAVPATDAVYVLPMPENEVEFGERQ